MRYLRAFKFSDTTLPGPNIYPYHCLNNKAAELLVFDTITMLYGDNGSGKSTFLNVLANQLQLAGAEKVIPYGLGNDYFQRYLAESLVLMAEDDNDQPYSCLKTAAILKVKTSCTKSKKSSRKQSKKKAIYMSGISWA